MSHSWGVTPQNCFCAYTTGHKFMENYSSTVCNLIKVERGEKEKPGNNPNVSRHLENARISRDIFTG